MNTSVASAGEVFWVVGILAWYVVRRRFERQARRVRVVDNRRSLVDMIGLGAALLGQGFIPAFYLLTGEPAGADYSAQAPWVAVGAVLFSLGLWLFRRTHKELGRNWSISLEIRDNHRLVDTGPYSLVRHPMYTSFLLLALGQALLLSNWVVGFAGLIGFLVLFFLRVGKEERMMADTFGARYGDYMKMTKRVIPYLY